MDLSSCARKSVYEADHVHRSTHVRNGSTTGALSHLCVQRIIWTPSTLSFDSLDTQKFRSGLADDDNSRR